MAGSVSDPLQSQNQQFITDSNKSPLVEVITWFTLSIIILSLLARLGTKMVQIGHVVIDDHLSILSTLAALGQSIAVLLQCNHGWGQHLDALDTAQKSQVFKAGYAADVLFVISLGLAKVSFAMTVSTLAQQLHKRIVWGIVGLTTAWAVSSFFVIIFQCSLPTPWQYLGETCIDRVGFWTYFSVLNILTDVAILGITVEAVRRIQTSWSKKIVVMSVFGSRIIVLPVIIAQIYYSNLALDSSDPTFDMWQTTVLVQVVQCLSIFTACVPVLKPFLDSLESGQLRADHLRRKGRSGYGYNSDHGPSNGASRGRSGSKQNVSMDVLGSSSSHRSKVHELVDMAKQKRTPGYATTTEVTHDSTQAWDGQSHTSQKGLIQQIKTWDITVERRDSSGVVEENRDKH